MHLEGKGQGQAKDASESSLCQDSFGASLQLAIAKFTTLRDEEIDQHSSPHRTNWRLKGQMTCACRI
jgi:hypothetical protein